MAIPDLLPLTAQIVAAHVGGNKVTADALPGLINEVYGALVSAGSSAAGPASGIAVSWLPTGC